MREEKRGVEKVGGGGEGDGEAYHAIKFTSMNKNKI
jgi:hypothetical protein